MADIEHERMAEALHDEFGGWVAAHQNASLFDWDVAAQNVIRAITNQGAVEDARKMYEDFTAERRMLREALAEYGESDEKLAARYAELRGR